MTSTTTARIASLETEIRTVAASTVLVETNEGTFGPAECLRAVGTGDTSHGNYRLYERVGDGSRFRDGCSAGVSLGNARYLGRGAVRQARERLAALRAELESLRTATRS